MKRKPDSFDSDTFDLATHHVLRALKQGDVEPLARHLEEGGYLCQTLRDFLAASVRREIEYARGNKRTLAQMQKEDKHLLEIALIRADAAADGQLISEHAAMKKYLERHPEMNEETLKGYVRKSKSRKKSE